MKGKNHTPFHWSVIHASYVAYKPPFYIESKEYVYIDSITELLSEGLLFNWILICRCRNFCFYLEDNNKNCNISISIMKCTVGIYLKWLGVCLYFISLLMINAIETAKYILCNLDSMALNWTIKLTNKWKYNSQAGKQHT